MLGEQKTPDGSIPSGIFGGLKIGKLVHWRQAAMSPADVDAEPEHFAVSQILHLHGLRRSERPRHRSF